MAAVKRSEKAVFSVRSAESPNGGARIKGASRDGARIAKAARSLTIQRDATLNRSTKKAR